MSESGLTSSTTSEEAEAAEVANGAPPVDGASSTLNGSASLAVDAPDSAVPAQPASSGAMPAVASTPPAATPPVARAPQPGVDQRVAQPGVGMGAPSEGEDVFARAVGLAEAPAARDRRGRRRGDTGRTEVAPEDAVRLASNAQRLSPAQGADPRAAGLAAEPVVDPGSKNASWLQRRRLRVRRTRRTLRHIDPWSVFKVSLLLYACLYVAVTIAGVILWSAAIGSGLVDKIESFIESVMQYELFEFQGDEIFSAGTKIGVVAAAAGVALNVVLAILFNLISDLVGGIRVTILEEDGVPRSGI